MHLFTMAVLRIAKDQYAEMQSKLAHHEDALRSLRWGGADIATLRRSRADLWQVQPDLELAFDKLIGLLDNENESDARADKLSSEILDLMLRYVEFCSFSRADYSLNCWDHAWQGVLTELTAI